MVRPPNDGVHLETPQAQTGIPTVHIASRRQRGERQEHPEGSRAAARWPAGKYSTGTTVLLDLPVQ